MKKHNFTHTHLAEDPKKFTNSEKSGGKQYAQFQKSMANCGLGHWKGTETMDLLGKSRHVTQVKAGKGGFVVSTYLQLEQSWKLPKMWTCWQDVDFVYFRILQLNFAWIQAYGKRIKPTREMFITE